MSCVSQLQHVGDICHAVGICKDFLLYESRVTYGNWRWNLKAGDGSSSPLMVNPLQAMVNKGQRRAVDDISMEPCPKSASTSPICYPSLFWENVGKVMMGVECKTGFHLECAFVLCISDRTQSHHWKHKKVGPLELSTVSNWFKRWKLWDLP